MVLSRTIVKRIIATAVVPQFSQGRRRTSSNRTLFGMLTWDESWISRSDMPNGRCLQLFACRALLVVRRPDERLSVIAVQQIIPQTMQYWSNPLPNRTRPLPALSTIRSFGVQWSRRHCSPVPDCKRGAQRNQSQQAVHLGAANGKGLWKLERAGIATDETAAFLGTFSDILDCASSFLVAPSTFAKRHHSIVRDVFDGHEIAHYHLLSTEAFSTYHPLFDLQSLSGINPGIDCLIISWSVFTSSAILELMNWISHELVHKSHIMQYLSSTRNPSPEYKPHGRCLQKDCSLGERCSPRENSRRFRRPSALKRLLIKPSSAGQILPESDSLCSCSTNNLEFRPSPGVGVVFLLFPIDFVATIIIRNGQFALIYFKDERTKIVNEKLNGI